MNPARKKSISYQPSRVTAAILSYIPNLEGYFTHRLDVLKLSLESLIQTLPAEIDIVVMNNGGCSQVIEYLNHQLELERIDYVIHSHRNLGVIGGFKVLFNAVPGELIAYCDDDVFYYPGWLEAHLRILEAYPQTGMVSGAPVGYSSEHATTAVDEFIAGASEGLTIEERSRVLDWEESWAISTGRDVADHLKHSQNNPHQLLALQGVDAVTSAKHFQFLTPKKVICQALETDWSGSLMDGLVELDEAVDRLGYLRLSTPERYTRHIGNTISAEILEEANLLGINLDLDVSDIREGEHWILKIPGSGRLLWPLYRWLFKVLHKVR
jgi:hypothetical protein